MGRTSSFPSVPGDRLAWLTARQMREVDRIATEELGIGLIQMMENAGRALADLAMARFGPATATILVGKGGNGGGGIAAARHLSNRGVAVAVVLAGHEHDLGEVPRLQLRIAERMGLQVSVPQPADLVVDALLGYSGRGDPEGRTAELISWANGSDRAICALDIPSGLDATTGTVGVPCARATATLTLAMPKSGLRGHEDVVGELYLADISVPPIVYERLGVRADPPFREGSLVRIG
jgi:NAD(P)H-hydrate epimerase